MTRSNAPAYMTGFGNHFATEAAPGALPVGRNSPQKTRMGLYAEQLSGTAFTAPRAENRRSWLYRRTPSAAHGEYRPLPHGGIVAEMVQRLTRSGTPLCSRRSASLLESGCSSATQSSLTIVERWIRTNRAGSSCSCRRCRASRSRYCLEPTCRVT